MSRKICAILDDYQDVALRMADWGLVADRVEVRRHSQHFESEDRLVEAIREAEIVVIMRERTPFRRSLLERLPALRLLVTSGMRNGAIDLGAAAERGVVVCGTESSSEPPTELTWALILGLARRVHLENSAFRSGGPWQSSVGADLHGKTLGLLGLGKIGSRVARIGQAFGMNVCAWSQNLTRERAEEAGVRWASSKAELLETSDFVSIHLVLGDRTRGLVGDAELRRMKPSGFLINTSRAAIVDREPLLRALRESRIAGAAFDVFEQEPLPPEDPFRDLPNFLGTPHLGYVTESNYRTYFRQAVEDVQAYLGGKPIRVLL
jgi:phosphoglycerate dehydrogenase-like enzyme